MTKRLKTRHREVLEDLRDQGTQPDKRIPPRWLTPQDIGGSNGSHHSDTLALLVRRGYVQFKQRGAPDPPDYLNGRKIHAERGSKCYRITPAGEAALK